MKFSIALVLSVFVGSVASFTTVQPTTATTRPVLLTRPRYMFSGAGEGVPKQDNPEELAKMEAAARQMGMSVEEYKLGLTARSRLAEELNNARVTGGNMNTVGVERDGNNPPCLLQVTITEEGKKLGQSKVSDALVKALKEASDKSRSKRSEAQKGMMAYISEEMKKLGAS